MSTQTAAPRRYIHSLADGDNIEEVYLVIDKQLRANRNGNLFIQVELRDRRSRRAISSSSRAKCSCSRAPCR
jgi:hypothetical protein